jgi:hypothetical protein
MTTSVTTATNTSAPDLSIDQTNGDRYFNNFSAINFSIGRANDALVAYFQEYTGNAASGQALAAAVIYTARLQAVDPMQVLTQFKNMTANELNTYLAAFLNFNRIPTSLIGIKTTPMTSAFVTRAVLP